MDTERANYLLKKHGAVELSKTAEGKAILVAAAQKYRKELLQPFLPNGRPNPEFQRVYGDKLKRDALLRAHNEDISKAMWERSRWEQEQKRKK